MLQLQVLRQNPERVKERLAVKNFKEINLVDEVIALDDQRKRLQLEADVIRSKMNLSSQEVSHLYAKGLEVSQEKRMEVMGLKSSLQPILFKMDEIEKKLKETLIKLPNLPSDFVPVNVTPGTGELKITGYPPDVIVTSLGNVVVREGGVKPKLPKDATPHWDLAKKYNLIDFELGNKITGSGFPVYINKGAKIQRALIQYFLDFNTAAGYMEYQPPLMVNETSAYGTGQLPDKEGQMYHAAEDNFYMIPTSEVPLTNIYRDVILKETDMPIKMTAYTPCFRREAGSYGKDVRGLNRLHQFDKVELVQLVHPEKSYDVLEDMVEHVEKLLNSLNLPYRILKLCGGDMSFTSALTYDFEVYSAAQERWLEVSSVSNFEAFQTNRMKIRFKDTNGKMQLVHSLNGSSLALPRILACLLENNQTTDGINIPVVLHNYFGSSSIS